MKKESQLQMQELKKQEKEKEKEMINKTWFGAWALIPNDVNPWDRSPLNPQLNCNLPKKAKNQVKKI